MYIFKCLYVIIGVNIKNHIIIMLILKFEYSYNISDLVVLIIMHNIRNKSKLLMRKYHCNNRFINSMFDIYIYKYIFFLLL